MSDSPYAIQRTLLSLTIQVKSQGAVLGLPYPAFFNQDLSKFQMQPDTAECLNKETNKNFVSRRKELHVHYRQLFVHILFFGNNTTFILVGNSLAQLTMNRHRTNNSKLNVHMVYLHRAELNGESAGL